MQFDEISEPVEIRLNYGLSRLAAVARQLDWQAAEAAGLSPTQADILRFVAARPQGIRLTTAAAHASVSKATASDVVNALEQKKLVRKHADTEDGRAIALKATAKGRKVAAAWPASFLPAVEHLTISEQEQLLELLISMIRQLQQLALIAPQRMCISCKHFRKNPNPGSTSPHYCSLVGAPMYTRHLRLDCPEHAAAA